MPVPGIQIGVAMEVIASELPEVILVRPRLFHDPRGHFFEIYQQKRYGESGVSGHFVQDNVSYSNRDVLRGLHYQAEQAQDKLVVVLCGQIFDVAVDIRRGSPYFGRWTSAILSSEDYTQIYIPKGFAHGFCVLSESAVVLYKCTDYYSPPQERGIRWDCPSLGIPWPVSNPVVSDKDQSLPFLSAIPQEDLPRLETTEP